MSGIPPLEGLGRRIMICGPSSTGKTTLANALGSKLGVPTIALDLLRHRENSDWDHRPDSEFVALHDAVISRDEWIADGNYAKLMRQRMARATAVILSDDSRWANLLRYLQRSIIQRDHDMRGMTRRIRWSFLMHILLRAPREHRRIRKLLRASGVPIIEVSGMNELNRLYERWGLTRG